MLATLGFSLWDRVAGWPKRPPSIPEGEVPPRAQVLTGGVLCSQQLCRWKASCGGGGMIPCRLLSSLCLVRSCGRLHLLEEEEAASECEGEEGSRACS